VIAFFKRRKSPRSAPALPPVTSPMLEAARAQLAELARDTRERAAQLLERLQQRVAEEEAREESHQ
jgi:hypothetical protein